MGTKWLPEYCRIALPKLSYLKKIDIKHPKFCFKYQIFKVGFEPTKTLHTTIKPHPQLYNAKGEGVNWGGTWEILFCSWIKNIEYISQSFFLPQLSSILPRYFFKQMFEMINLSVKIEKYF